MERLMTVVANPRQFKVPDWFLNRKKDYKDGRFSQVVSNALDMKLRDDLERLKKIRYTPILYFVFLLRNTKVYLRVNGTVCKPSGLWICSVLYLVGFMSLAVKRLPCKID
jgi:hypothetical protein